MSSLMALSLRHRLLLSSASSSPTSLSHRSISACDPALSRHEHLQVHCLMAEHKLICCLVSHARLLCCVYLTIYGPVPLSSRRSGSLGKDPRGICRQLGQMFAVHKSPRSRLHLFCVEEGRRVWEDTLAALVVGKLALSLSDLPNNLAGTVELTSYTM